MEILWAAPLFFMVICRFLRVLWASSKKNCSRVLSALPKEKSPTSRSLCYSLYIWQPTFMEYFISFWDMYVDIWKVHTCGSHWRLSQRCSSRLGLGKVDCAFPFLKMWKSPPLVSCDSPFLFWCVQCLESVWCVLADVWAFFQHDRMYFFNGMYWFFNGVDGSLRANDP